VLPVIVLTQLGVIVGIGVVLDTLLVRTIVVPALALLLGRRFWWPAKPADRAATRSDGLLDSDDDGRGVVGAASGEGGRQ
jgi:RND superfamily putative drug exporter